jgi:hypothetical protein
LAASFGSAKSHHQAINKNYKNGNPGHLYVDSYQYLGKRMMYDENFEVSAAV